MGISKLELDWHTERVQPYVNSCAPLAKDERDPGLRQLARCALRGPRPEELRGRRGFREEWAMTTSGLKSPFNLAEMDEQRLEEEEEEE